MVPPAAHRIHILGLGSIGNFAAHCPASLAKPPPVTLLFHRAGLEQEFKNNKRSITLQTYEGDITLARGFDTEVFQKGHWHRTVHEPTHGVGLQTKDHISHLLVCTKTIQTVEAIRPLVGRLTAASTILLLQNGCGVMDALNQELFQEEQNRPSYVIGITSHGVGLKSPFSINHAGPSATSLGAVSRASPTAGQPDLPELCPAQECLLDTLCQSERINAKAYTLADAFKAQLEKLAVNAFCNPLCAIHDAKNGFLFTLPATRRAILSEIADVVLAMPELSGIPGLSNASV